MAITSTERGQQMVERLKQSGGERLTCMLSAEASAALATLCETHGTKRAAVECLLLGAVNTTSPQ